MFSIFPICNKIFTLLYKICSSQKLVQFNTLLRAYDIYISHFYGKQNFPHKVLQSTTNLTIQISSYYITSIIFKQVPLTLCYNIWSQNCMMSQIFTQHQYSVQRKNMHYICGIAKMQQNYEHLSKVAKCIISITFW